MRRVLIIFLTLVLAGSAFAGDRVPGERWMRYADPAEAGFDPARLEAARKAWESLPSSAFFVVADGAVVAAWGEPDRRFMCHSVRKSFLSALYGIYWDRGKIDLDMTLADLGVDDSPGPLLPSERQARVLDLLKARSGVFHPAAYAGRTDSRARGSQGPGRFFAYNNWDFNTLATILEEQTGARVFEAFEEHFARPLGMQDFRVSGFVGRFSVPAPPLGLPAESRVAITAREGHLVGVWDHGGTFALYVQPDGTLRREDSRGRFFAIRGPDGTLAGIADVDEIARGALGAAGEGRDARARELLALAGDDDSLPITAAQTVVALLGGDRESARRRGKEAAARLSAPAVEGAINRAGYRLLQAEKAELARRVFELNTELFPEAFNTWDSLGEATAKLGRVENALRLYERSLALNPENRNACAALEKLRAAFPRP